MRHASPPAIVSKRVENDVVNLCGKTGTLSAIVDFGVLNINVTRYLQERRILSLYTGISERNFKHNAPYILKCDPKITNLLSNLQVKNWGFFVDSPSNIVDVRQHFRRFLTVLSPEGKPWLFRFYDPGILPSFLSACSASEVDDFFGVVNSFILCKTQSNISIERSSDCIPTRRHARAGPFRLEARHLKSLRGTAPIIGLREKLFKSEEDVVFKNNTLCVHQVAGEPITASTGETGFIEHFQQPSLGVWSIKADSTGSLKKIDLPSQASIAIENRFNIDDNTISINDRSYASLFTDEIGRTDSVYFWDHTRAKINYIYSGACSFADPTGIHISSRTDRLGRTDRYSYKDERLESITDANGRRMVFEYAQGGEPRPSRITFPDGTNESFIYNKEWLPILIKRPDGSVLGYRFDVKGNVTSATHNSIEIYSNYYDQKFRLIRSKMKNHEVKWAYNECGNVISECTRNNFVEYKYSSNMYLSEIKYSTGGFQKISRDGAGRITSIGFSNSTNIYFEYDVGSSDWRFKTDDGWAGFTRTNPLGFVDQRKSKHMHGAETEEKYIYDFENRITSEYIDRRRTEYVYDAESQLLVASCNDGSTESFVYDGAGNIVGGSLGDANVNELDQLLASPANEYSYDPNGSISKIETATCSWNFTHDAVGNLVSAENEFGARIRFDYDALSRRISKTVSKDSYDRRHDFFWAGEQLAVEKIHVLQDGRTVKEQTVEYYYWPQTSVLMAMRQDGQFYWCQSDAKGRIIKVFDLSGALCWAANYTAYGLCDIYVSEVHQPMRMPGQYDDYEVSLYYNRFRYYDPAIGRYTSRDRIGLLGGLNHYQYCGNDPINRADPTGLWWKAAVSIVAAVAVGALVVATAPVSGPILIIAAGAAAGATAFAVNEALNQEEFCLSCIGLAGVKGAVVGAAASVPFLFLPASAGVFAFMAAGAASGGVAYTTDLALSPGAQWSWTDFAWSLAIGGFLAGAARIAGPPLVRWWNNRRASWRNNQAPKGPRNDASIEEALDGVYERAPQAKVEIDALAEEIAAAHEGTVAKSPLKGRERALEKVVTDYQGDVSRLSDVARNTIVVEEGQIANVVRELEARGATVRVIDPATDPLGYSGATAKIRTSNGQFAEIQINSPEMIFAKEPPATASTILGEENYQTMIDRYGNIGGRGHQIYEQVRGGAMSADQVSELSRQSVDYYNTFRKSP